MKHFGITIISGVAFLVVAYLVGALAVPLNSVSPETGFFGRYRETLSVKQGVSQDGLLAISRIPEAPLIPPRAKSANHARTLRAFFAPDRGGVLTLYVENAKPHEYYSLTGDFIVSEKYPVILWTSETVLAFYGMSPKGESMRFTADVHLGTFTQEILNPSDTIPTKSIPSADLLP